MLRLSIESELAEKDEVDCLVSLAFYQPTGGLEMMPRSILFVAAFAGRGIRLLGDEDTPRDSCEMGRLLLCAASTAARSASEWASGLVGSPMRTTPRKRRKR